MGPRGNVDGGETHTHTHTPTRAQKKKGMEKPLAPNCCATAFDVLVEGDSFLICLLSRFVFSLTRVEMNNSSAS